MDHLAQKLNITVPDGWYSITLDTFLKRGGARLYQKYNSMFKIFSSVYPEYRIILRLVTTSDTSGIQQLFADPDGNLNDIWLTC